MSGELFSIHWIKPSYTNNPTLNWCFQLARVTVEDARLANAVIDGKEGESFLILVSDSVNPAARPLAFTQHEFAALWLGINRHGEFRELLDPAVMAEVTAAQPAA